MASVDEVWLLDFGAPYPGEPASRRPAVIVGPARQFTDAVPPIIVCPLTTTKRPLSVHIEVEATPDNGLDETSYVQCELVRAVSPRRLVHRLGTVEAQVIEQVRWVLGALLDF